jgi:hypothetical protein
VSTDELIRRLAAAGGTPAGPRRLLGIAVGVAVLAAFGMALAMWGPRPDLAAALGTAGFWMKADYAAALALAGGLAVERLGRPGEPARRAMIVAGLAILTVLALAARELAGLTPEGRAAAVMGHSWQVCSLRIAAISLPGFVAAFWALRQMAPTRPRLAGAAAGLMAGGLGATAYSLTCTETAAAFLASWYSLGMAVWAAVGAIIGPRLLRW